MDELAQAVIKPKKRANYIDIAKGVVILLVVYGHAVTFQGIPFFIIFSFHMPFFFFISGWCKAFSDRQEKFLVMLRKSFVKLIIPSIIFRAIRFWQPDDLKAWGKSIFLDPYSEWFLATMFVINILFFFFKKFDLKNNNLYLKLGFMAAVVGITPIFVQLYIYWGLHMKVGFPFSFDCVAIGFSFSVVGYYLKKFMKKNPMPKPNVLSVLSILIVLAISVKLIFTNSYVNVCDGMLGISDTFFYFCALLLTCVVMYLSKESDKLSVKNSFLKGLNKLLELYGRNSLWIYLCHIIMFDKYTAYLSANQIVINHYLQVALYTIVTMVVLTPIFMIIEKIKKTLKAKKQRKLA